MIKKFKGFGPFNFAIAATVAIVIGSIAFSGWYALLPVTALALIEIIFSFENAVINSQVLSTMRRLWRIVFLTVGILVAVFLVRAILPLVLVSTTIDESLSYVWDLALHNPEQYAIELEEAYPVIAAFGGVFLLMVGLRFFGEKRSVRWLNGLEAPLGEFNQPWWVSVVGALFAVSIIYTVLAPGDVKLALAGALGGATFLAVKLISQLLIGRESKSDHRTHRHGLSQFLYLELLDASFSFDSVIAAFAITKDIVLIIAGLAIGAVFVRSMTLQLLREGTLREYRYLVHGAHYAILALATLLLAGIKFDIPEAVAGVIGILIIATAFEASRRHNKLLAVS
ncbi:hypothetical protein A3E49_02810 [Candidatus Saccharibacteria bacterium RIFCSPHIGHO2_12_FULL_49_19]|nr:MAG: hypothetical protein A3E49_02810 [Candidatus Saccharibacteria bacterium RIFCSPHIGHO2_12_FULL_49_19]